MVGPSGHIVGLDITKEFLEEAYCLVSKSGLKDRITFKVGDVNAIPYSDNTFGIYSNMVVTDATSWISTVGSSIKCNFGGNCSI
ncbi:class I SAM-dependent methyltransferase [Desulfoscipio geothermicus]|uniref:class I SAM-dependent methyltransferase n=1 Tax=Desulfoscipio geothermicus TaxID=39060 RepID=UPI003CCC1122